MALSCLSTFFLLSHKRSSFHCSHVTFPFPLPCAWPFVFHNLTLFRSTIGDTFAGDDVTKTLRDHHEGEDDDVIDEEGDDVSDLSGISSSPSSSVLQKRQLQSLTDSGGGGGGCAGNGAGNLQWGHAAVAGAAGESSLL
jgi:hypothetical protein